MNKSMHWIAYAIAMMIIVAIFSLGRGASEPVTEISYSDFKSLVLRKEVESVQLQGDTIVGTLLKARNFGGSSQPGKNFQTMAPGFGDARLLETLETASVNV